MRPRLPFLESLSKFFHSEELPSTIRLKFQIVRLTSIAEQMSPYKD